MMLSLLTEQVLLLVEGQDESNFFKALFGHSTVTGVQIEDMKGKSKIKAYLAALKRASGFSNVSRMAVIRDADTDAAAAFDSVRNALRTNGLPYPTRSGGFNTQDRPHVGVYIIPDNKHSGMLEDLCLATVVEDPAFVCINGFLECVKDRTDSQPINPAKSRVATFLAAQPDPPPSLGVAALRGVWGLDHRALKPIISFLADLTP